MTPDASTFLVNISRGTSAASSSSRRQVLVTSLAFVAGFSLVFIALGASASAIGKLLMAKLPL